MRAVGKSGLGETIEMVFAAGAAPTAVPGVGLLNESVGFPAYALYVVTILNGGLLLRNVKVFIWFGL
jgi:hypothetical protein